MVSILKTDKVAVSDLREVDQYMLIKLNKLIKNTIEAYDNYEFATIYHHVNNFCTQDLSAFYLRLCKRYFILRSTERKRSFSDSNGAI